MLEIANYTFSRPSLERRGGGVPQIPQRWMAAAQFYVEQGADILDTSSGDAVKVEFSKNCPAPPR